MNFQKFFKGYGRWFILFVCIFCSVVFLVSCFHKEPYQQKKKEKDDHLMEILDKFANEHLGTDWEMDHVDRYNNKIIFVVIHTDNAIIDLSVQPENRAIIIENIKGKSPFQKRVYRF